MDKSKVLKNLDNRKKMFEEYLRQVKASAEKRAASKKTVNK